MALIQWAHATVILGPRKQGSKNVVSPRPICLRHSRCPSKAMQIFFSLVLLSAASAYSQSSDVPLVATPDKTAVGHGAEGKVQTPVNQILTAYGKQIELPGMRPQALALSHDSKLMAVSGKTNRLVIVDPKLGKVRQSVAMPGMNNGNQLVADTAAQVSFTGLIFSPDDRSIFLSDVNGSIKVFIVAEDGEVTPADNAAASSECPPASS